MKAFHLAASLNHEENGNASMISPPRTSSGGVIFAGSFVLWVGLLVLSLTRLRPCALEASFGLEKQEARAHLLHKDSSSGPKIAWLTSYPNSGTSYTLHVVRQVSNFTTATNYGEEHLFEGGNSLLVNTNWTHGPFWSHKELSLPPNYVLTKTHCGGRCVHCGPEKYIELPRSFRRACLQAKLFQNFTGSEVRYSAKLVQRTVHLIRDPLDNVVSRFHLSLKHGDNFTNDAKGFHAWCKRLDTEYRDHELHVRFFDSDLNHLFRSVPCHVEFYRFTEWHNLAIMAARFMGIPTHNVFYDDYASDWKGTVEGILDFLELPAPYQWENATQFEFRSYHQEYYSTEEKHNIRKLIRELASAETWELLRRYFQ